MLLEQLLDFEWLNEPADVDFREAGMLVSAKGGTDFWQNKSRNVHKDDGHFFFVRKCGNFVLTTHWGFDNMEALNQCGLMLRVDERNWIKASVMTDNPQFPKLGSCVAQNGYTDWAAFGLPEGINELWLRLKRQQGDYILFCSTDGNNFQQIRLFNLPNEDVEVKAGAYICAPKSAGFQALLKELTLSSL